MPNQIVVDSRAQADGAINVDEQDKLTAFIVNDIGVCRLVVS